MKRKLTLVTGANGLTGSAVVRALLSRKRRVRALVLENSDERNLEGLDVEIFHGDITCYKTMCRAMEGCDCVYHVAAEFTFARDMTTDATGYPADAESLYRNNLDGTTAVMLAARSSDVRKLVYTSTMATIGTTPGETASNEDHPFNIWIPLNDYMRSKYFAEQVVWKFMDAGLPVVVVNPTFTMGPGDINPTPVGSIVSDLLAGEEPKVSPAGVNIVDVDDVGEGHVLAEIRGTIGERYILGGHNVVFREFLSRVRELAGMPLGTDEVSGLTCFPRDYLWYETEKAKRVLGFSPRALDETIERSIAWFRSGSRCLMVGNA